MDGEVIGGYRLRNLMATGQTSQVWEVVQLSSNRHFAMKVLLPEKLREPIHRRFMIHEASVGIKLRHQNVVRIISINKSTKNPYYVMEFFPAGSLKVRLLRKQFDFIKERTQTIFKQAATALAYIHSSGWVHLDIKPDNMLVNGAGELRIIDFALAKRIQKKHWWQRFRRRSKVAGTLSYMSPEQIRNEYLDQRADIYSFGVTAYELVTGRPPFRASTAQELLGKHIAEKPEPPQMYNQDLTEAFSGLVLRMLAKKREQRPHDFHEILMALQGIRIFKSQTPTSQKGAGTL